MKFDMDRPPSHTGLFAFIREKYGSDILLSSRRFISTSKRLARYRQHLAFNYRCKRYSVIPIYLRVRPLVRSSEGKQLAEKFSRQSLSAQIALNHRTIARLKQWLEEQRRRLSSQLSEATMESLTVLKDAAYNATTERCKARQKSKFDCLLVRRNACAQTKQVSRERWVVNLSKTPLEDAEIGVLSKGLNFAPAPSKIPVTDLIAAVEKGLSKTSKEQATEARKRISNILSRAKPPPSNLLPDLRRAVSLLKKRDDILVLPADKGRATVVMDKCDYDEKMNKMLCDEKTYEPLKQDPALTLEKKLNTLLLQLKKKGSISPELYNRLRSSGGLTPHLYGLPKVHKPDVPLRPIVSFIQSPSYQLSKHLAKILTPLIGNSDSHVRNSSEFVSFIRSVTLRPDDVLVSFDVVSLFTNVPVQLAVDVARRRLEADTSLASRTSLSTQELVQLLEFSLNATYLCFRGRVYRQTYGTAMGSPVSVSVANLVMEDVEERALSTFDVHLPFWKRYVDDTCTAVPGDRVQDLLQHLNQVEESIKFTVEEESSGSIPFLDVLLRHELDGSVSTSVYRKATHTDRYLDFESHHPLSHKKSVISTLHSRAETHSSSQPLKALEAEHISCALGVNGYPSSFVRQQISCRGKVSRGSRALSSDQPKWKSTTVIPYVRGVSESLRRVLAPLRIRVCFKPQRTLRQILSKPKDPTPDLERSNVVYKIPCASCPASYIGQTGRRLRQRLDEHKRAVRTADFGTSALAEHAWRSDHPVDWAGVRILASPHDYRARLVQEAFLIRTSAHTVNRDEGTLPVEYGNLIGHAHSRLS